ncbi:MAG: ROK family protein, partial [Pseudomonadota bacterium]
YSYPTPEETLAFAREAVDEICAELSPAQQGRIAGLGIASPFFLWEWAAMIGVDPAKMAAWKGFDLQAEMAEMFEFPVFLGNDATSACGAELTFGSADTPPDFLYIYVGYFIGGGIALHGATYSGRAGNAGAIGPFPIMARDGTTRQLVDTASLIGLERRVEAEAGDITRMMAQQEDWDIADHIVDDWLTEAAPSIAQLIAGTISIIDFTTVLIDGNMPARLRDKVIEHVRRALEDMPLSGLLLPEIRAGSLGPRARSLGAASLPLSNRFMLEA